MSKIMRYSKLKEPTFNWWQQMWQVETSFLFAVVDHNKSVPYHMTVNTEYKN